MQEKSSQEWNSNKAAIKDMEPVEYPTTKSRWQCQSEKDVFAVFIIRKIPYKLL